MQQAKKHGRPGKLPGPRVSQLFANTSLVFGCAIDDDLYSPIVRSAFSAALSATGLPFSIYGLFLNIEFNASILCPTCIRFVRSHGFIEASSDSSHTVRCDTFFNEPVLY